MNTNKNKEASDYGEPWALDATDGFLNKVVSTDGKCVSGLGPTRRAIQCVNACAGMADPAAELAAMREAIAVAQALAEWSARYPRGVIYSASNRQMDAELIELEESAKAAMAKLQPFTTPTA